MNENLYNLFDDVLTSDFSIKQEGAKKIIELGANVEYGRMETYSIFPGVVLAYMDMHIDNVDDVFFEEKLPSRLLEINHCADGRYSYAVGDDKVIYFGRGICVLVFMT